MTGGLEVRLLGGTVLVGAGHEPVPVRGAQPATVIARLTLDPNRPLDRNELTELIWEPGAEGGAGAARQVVSRARTAVSEATGGSWDIRSGEGGVMLVGPGPLEVDVVAALATLDVADAEFAAGRRDLAAAAVAGLDAQLSLPFLPSMTTVWPSSWRDRLAAAARRSRHIELEAALRSGRRTLAVQLAQSALTADPLDEVATRFLMEAWMGLGDRAAALAAYERCRRRLDEQLGVRPAPETERAYLTLLGGAPRPRSGPGRVAARRAGVAELVGRDTEREQLRDEWLAALGDPGCRVVVLEGEPGIGKTALAAQVAADTAGASVLWGACGPGSIGGYEPFPALLSQLVMTLPGIVDDLGPIRSDLAPLLPELGPGAPSPLHAPGERSRDPVFRATERALAAAAGTATGGLLIVVDDVHWVDSDAAALMLAAVAALADLPALVLLTARDGSTTAAALIAELHRFVPVSSIRLEGLDRDGMTELLVDSCLELVGPLDEVLSTLEQRTGGNPLYLAALLDDARADGRPLDPAATPASVADVIRRRVDALDQDDAAVLAAAAVAGPDVELAVLELMVGADALPSVERICRARLLDERENGRFGFPHSLVRDVVLDSMLSSRRTALHLAASEALTARGAPPATVAHHRLAADADDAHSWAALAGAHAWERGAWAEAVAHHRVAAERCPDASTRGTSMVELGRALRAVGDVDDARRVLEEARSVGLSAGASRVVAAATLALVGGGGRGSAIDLDDAGRAELLREALVGLGDEDVDLLVPVLGELALALVLTDAVDERVALCERALAEARRWGDPGGLASALFTQRIALMGPGGTEARAVGSDEVLSLPAADVAPQDRLAALLGKVEDHLELGRRATAEAALAEAEDLVDRFPHTYWRWATACWRTLLTIVDGRLDDAEAAAFAAHEIQPEHPEATAALGVNLVAVRLFQGRAEEVCDLLTEAANANPHIPAYRAVLALCAAESGQHDLAQSCIDHFADCDFVLPPDSNWLLAVAVLADAVATVGDAGRAERLARLLEPWADRQVILNCFGGGGAFWGPVSHQLGRLAVLLGDDVLGRALLERAVDAAEAMRAPLAAARAAEHLAPLA